MKHILLAALAATAALTACHKSDPRAELLAKIAECRKADDPRSSLCSYDALTRMDLKPLNGIMLEDLVAVLGPPDPPIPVSMYAPPPDCPACKMWGFYRDVRPLGFVLGDPRPKLICDPDPTARCAAVRWVRWR